MRAQSSVEYVIAIGAVLGALFLIQTYVRRALQARYQTMVDGAVLAIANRDQYEPYYPSGNSTVTQQGEVVATYRPGGIVGLSVDQNAPVSTIEDAGSWEKVGVDLKDDDDWK